MEPSPQTQNIGSQNNKSEEQIPKQVKLAAWLSVFGTIMVGGIASATPIWSVAGACIGIAVMMAIVCYAIIRYR